MATATQEWKELCAEFLAARDAETQLLGQTIEAGGDPDLEIVEQFEAAHERTEEVKRRMDAWLDAYAH